MQCIHEIGYATRITYKHSYCFKKEKERKIVPNFGKLMVMQPALHTSIAIALRKKKSTKF